MSVLEFSCSHMTGPTLLTRGMLSTASYSIPEDLTVVRRHGLGESFLVWSEILQPASLLTPGPLYRYGLSHDESRRDDGDYGNYDDVN